MKKFYFLSIFLSISIACSGQTKYDVTFPFEGRSRELIVSVPTKQPPAGGYPLVIMLHGTSGNKDVFYNVKGWKELGQQENFVTVFPSALEWCFFEDGIKRNTSRFVCGSVIDSICADDIPNLIDDVAFLKKIVTLLKDTLPLNMNKVFINGFSNGSCMSHKMALAAGDVFRCAAGSSSGLHELDSITPAIRIPFWYMVGTKDDRFFTPGFPDELPYGGDSILWYLNKQISRALVCQGLTQKFSRVETAINKTYIWRECRPGEKCAPYIFTINKEQKHQFPNGNNHPVDAPKLFWEFFNDPPDVITMTSTSESQILESSTSIYPNPAHDHLIVETGLPIDKSWELRIKDLQNRDVISPQYGMGPQTQVQLTHLSDGMYLVYVIYSGHTISRKLIVSGR